MQEKRLNSFTARSSMLKLMSALFLNPPSFDGFDGAAGSRYQARREITSFTWLARLAKKHTALPLDSRVFNHLKHGSRSPNTAHSLGSKPEHFAKRTNLRTNW